MLLTLLDPRGSRELLAWLQPAYYRYLEELAAFDPDMYVLDPEGHWQPDYLPYWLEHAWCHPLVIADGGRPRGFAFIGEQPFPFMSAGRDFRLCEFYVDADARRSNIGRSAVRTLLAARPGAWELFVLQDNTTARHFWATVLEGEAADVTSVPGEYGVLMSFTSTRHVARCS